MNALPTGTVTFLFSDIVGSTRTWENDPDAMRTALARHDAIMRTAIVDHDGYVFSTAGDAFAASFGRVGDAVAAAKTAQAALADESWPETAALVVRMGVDTGEAEERDGGYFGPVLNRAARIMSAAHGGQILVSASAASLLDEELLVDLGEHRLKDLSVSERLWQLGDTHFPPLRTLDRALHNLPVQRTDLVGRGAELGHVAELLGGHRLVTLTGLGGAGKTRLALAAAAELMNDFDDGVFFVDLSPLADGELVPQAIASAVGLTMPVDQRRGPSELVAAELGERRLLLVLDNCEHLIEEAAETVDELLGAGDGVRVLATSRESLSVEGEHTMRVPPLDWESGTVTAPPPAVQLLLERAADAGSDLDLDADLPLLRELCERMDGMPLAIELAAVQLRHLPPRDLIAKLDDRFRILVGGRRRRHRQRTLTAMMDWSWELLDERERQVLAAASVFAGGFTQRAIDAVTGLHEAELSSLLGQLVAKSLLVPAPDQWGARYRLLETVRLYGSQKLHERGELESTRTAHATWLADWCDESSFEEHWLSADHAARMRRDFENVRAALDWLAGTDLLTMRARIIRSCCYLFREDFYRDESLEWTSGEDWSGLPSADRARLELVIAEARFVHLDYEGMRDAGYRAYEIAASAGEDKLAAAGLLVSCQGLLNVDPEVGIPRVREAITRAQRAGSRRVEAVAWNFAFSAAVDAGLDEQERRDIVARTYELAGPSGLDHETAISNDALLRLETGDAVGGHNLYVTLIDEALARGLTTSAARVAISAACCAAEIPDRRLFHQDVQLAVDEFHRAGVHRAAADLTMVLGYWEAHNGDPNLAAELLAVARRQALFDMTSYHFWRRARDTVRRTGDAAALDGARRRGAHEDVATTLMNHLERHGVRPRPFRSDRG